MSKKYKRVQTPRVTLFLGAGASRAFHYPTTKEFLAWFKGYLSKRAPTSYFRIIETFEDSGGATDIEHILQMLDAFIGLHTNSLVENLLNKHPPAFLDKSREPPFSRFVDSSNWLKELIINGLYDQYQFSEDKVSRIVSLYGRLFEDLAGFNENGRLDIFTSNYDSVVEEFCDNHETLDIELIDGFILRARSGRLYWRPEKAFERDFRKDAVLKLRLFKLHGSLNWGERSKGDIEKVIETQVADLERYRANVLIYPAQKTYEEEEPFSVLYKYFRDASKTSRVFVVIGFSFRDDLINRIFLDHLQANPRHKLIVVSPSATENVTKNLLEGKKSKLEKRIAKIDQEFGKDETFKAIRSAIVRFS